MLSRKKRNIVKSEVRPEPPLPLHPPAPVHHKDKTNFKKFNEQYGINKVSVSSSSSGGCSYEDTKINSSLPRPRQALLKNIKTEPGTLQVQSSESKAQLQASTNSALNGIIPRLGQMLGEDEEEEGVRNIRSMEKHRELRRLLHCLNDWDNINDQTLVNLISELKENLEILDEKMSPVIQQVLSAQWHMRSGKVVSAMEAFISEMLVVRASFVGVVIHALISKFNPLSFNTTAKHIEVDEISLSEQKVFSVSHRNLKKLFQMFPMKQETGGKVMGALYPFMGKEAHVHFCYVTNLLQSIEYMPESKSQTLHLIVHKLARIDVNVPRDDIEQMSAYHSNSTTSVNIKTEDGGHEVFSMELDSGETFTPNPLIQVVDVCLNLVLEHLNSESKSGLSNENLFSSLYSAFETEILPTFSLNNVQFLLFYLTSLDPSYATKFLDLMWKKAISVNKPAVIRIQVMAYMSGMLSRASFISIKTVKRWLTRFADWANSYVDHKVSSCHWSSVNVEAHGPFYAVCQTIFYIFAFRNKELIGTRRCVAYTRTLNLGRLVTSDLNPLKACGNEVAELFVSAAYIHQISYCRTVLERNQRATIPTSSRDSMANVGSQENSKVGTDEQLESFFPFDPFLLPRSRVWIDPIYRIYEPYREEFKIEKEDPYCETETNEDSIEMELGQSYSETNNVNSSIDYFCNGTSPFKFKSDIKDEMRSYEMHDFID